MTMRNQVRQPLPPSAHHQPPEVLLTYYERQYVRGEKVFASVEYHLFDDEGKKFRNIIQRFAQ